MQHIDLAFISILVQFINHPLELISVIGFLGIQIEAKEYKIDAPLYKELCHLKHLSLTHVTL